MLVKPSYVHNFGLEAAIIFLPTNGLIEVNGSIYSLVGWRFLVATKIPDCKI